MDPRVEAVLDVIAPRADWDEPEHRRFAIFEWPKETSPTDGELLDLATRIVAAVDQAAR
jgi:hypothetical protein